MSVARFLAGVFASGGESSSADDPNHWMLRGGWGGRTDAGVFVTERLALNLTAVQACVGLISDCMAMIPAAVESYDEATGRWTPVDNDPREYLLNVQPNEYMTPIVARKATQATTLLWGNAHGEIVRNGRGQGVELWPIPAGCIAPVYLRNNGNPEIRYQGSIDGQRFDKPPSEVLHLRGSLTLDGFNGLSPIAEARQAVGLGIAVERFGAKLFANDLKSGGWISGVTDTGEALSNFREYVNAQGGLDHAHLVKLLGVNSKGENLTFTPGTIPPEDAQFLGTRDFTIAEFARMFRVPLELLAAQGKTSSWGSGIEQLFLAFVQWTLRPWVTQWEQELSLKLLTSEELARGLRVRFQVKELLRGDSGARSAFYERMFNIGAMSVNEIRAEEGRNPVDGGDEMQPRAQSPTAPPSPLDQMRDRERKEDDEK